MGAFDTAARECERPRVLRRHPLFPKGAGTLVLKLSSAGLVADSTFGTLFSVPWSVVTGFSVEAADTAPRRIPTPTRLLAVGVASFVFKHSAYEQSHLVLETNDGEMVFAISQTPQKLRARLAPYVGAFGSAPQRAIGVTYRVGEGGQPARPSHDDPIEAIRRLAELRDAGALTKRRVLPQEGRAARPDLIGRI